MRKARLIGFVVAILLGVAGGLVLGWLYFPAEITTTSLQDLRADYKTDYVLMVAETYATDGDAQHALDLLTKINPDNPLRTVQQGLLTAQHLGYEDWEMRYLADLEIGIRNYSAPGAVNERETRSLYLLHRFDHRAVIGLLLSITRFRKYTDTLLIT